MSYITGTYNSKPDTKILYITENQTSGLTNIFYQSSSSLLMDSISFENGNMNVIRTVVICENITVTN